MRSLGVGSAVLFILAAGAQAQMLLERGSYLVNGIMTCNHCHTPKDRMKVFHRGGAETNKRKTFPTARMRQFKAGGWMYVLNSFYLFLSLRLGG